MGYAVTRTAVEVERGVNCTPRSNRAARVIGYCRVTSNILRREIRDLETSCGNSIEADGMEVEKGRPERQEKSQIRSVASGLSPIWPAFCTIVPHLE